MEKPTELNLNDLDGIAGGQVPNNEAWNNWAREWKNFWIKYYGDTRCWNCGRYLSATIEGYDASMAYDVYMNVAFLCGCGQVIRPVTGWKR